MEPQIRLRSVVGGAEEERGGRAVNWAKRHLKRLREGEVRNSAAKRKKERKEGGGGKSAQCLAPNTLAVGIANFSHMLPPVFYDPHRE